jgi:hypothetical protein
MSRARVQNFSISLDGFATGEGQAADAPFGHAGHRFHAWPRGHHHHRAVRAAQLKLMGAAGGGPGRALLPCAIRGSAKTQPGAPSEATRHSVHI